MWKINDKGKLSARQSSCKVDELTEFILDLVKDKNLANKISEELMIKVLTEKKESVEDFMEKYSSLGREVLERILEKARELQS
ncbi:MAG: hypothetical protein RQ872_08480 [Sulfolobaceae archaeon]|jgi:uncharacterized protein YaaN involved in tellurite resistance|nr:hypothetical protein [Sulfolobaceae archaeon]